MAKTPLDKEISKNYMEFNALLMSYFQENTSSLGYPNRGQAKILSILKDQPTISQKDLIAQLDMKPQSASELIKKLENKGLILREKSTEDKRVFLIELTDLGKIESEKGSEFEPIALNALTLEEKKQFNNILDKLIKEVHPKVKKKLKQKLIHIEPEIK